MGWQRFVHDFIYYNGYSPGEEQITFKDKILILIVRKRFCYFDNFCEGLPKKFQMARVLHCRVTGCRFVQVADSYTWSFQARTSFTMSIEKKLIKWGIKQATVSTIFSARARIACGFQSMQTIIFYYQCNSVSSTAVKFRNQHCNIHCLFL